MKKKIEKVTVAVEEMSTAEVLATVDAGDYEEEVEEIVAVDVVEDEDDDDELVDEPVPEKIAKAEIKRQKAELQKKDWLEKSKLDENGKHYIVVEDDYKNLEKNPTWHSCYYLLNDKCTTFRVNWEFAESLIKQGRTTRISKAQRKEMEKAYKAALKAEKKTAEAK